VLQPYLPDWWRALDGPPCAFALVPLRTGETVAALALIGWRAARRVAITPSQVNLVQQLCAPVLSPGAPASTLAA
jgi:hypothetical protein